VSGSIPEFFFAQYNPQIAVHPSGNHHLLLRGVPEGVVRFGVFQLPGTVEMLALILLMFFKRP